MDAFLHTLVVRSGHFSYCRLPISSRQAVHLLLTAGINKTFSQTKLLLKFSAEHFYITEIKSTIKTAATGHLCVYKLLCYFSIRKTTYSFTSTLSENICIIY